ncbi:MAG: hypothetical protein KZQ64_08880 [gamma proteobacterium symbiont of Bathyaustriella thionipta]|nr:hypothetical protein [gamma proteobacterium symbiont of Bathyaustriella thionipta]
MAKLPEKTKQIAQVHAQLINSVVMACHNKTIAPQLEPVLQSSAQNGWIDLVARIRKIMAGSRNTKLLIGLDEEDAGIILAILVGLQDSTQLPKITNEADSKFAAPGLAKMIHAASKGDVTALSALGDMAQQMVTATGDIRYLGAVIQPIINGERDIKRLTNHMGEQGVKLVEGLLEELEQLNSE